MPRAANASPSATSKGARALPPAPWVSTSPSPDGARGSWSASLTRCPGRSRDPAVDHVAAIGGVGANVLGPAPFLHRLRPRVTGEHGGALDLVERVVGGLALDHDRLALPADYHCHRLALEARDRDDAGYLEQRRHVLGVVDLVEDRVLVRANAHGGAEEVAGLHRHDGLLSGSDEPILAHPVDAPRATTSGGGERALTRLAGAREPDATMIEEEFHDVRWRRFSSRLRRPRPRDHPDVQQARRTAAALRGSVVGHRRAAQAAHRSRA